MTTSIFGNDGANLNPFWRLYNGKQPLEIPLNHRGYQHAQCWAEFLSYQLTTRQLINMGESHLCLQYIFNAVYDWYSFIFILFVAFGKKMTAFLDLFSVNIWISDVISKFSGDDTLFNTTVFSDLVESHIPKLLVVWHCWNQFNSLIMFASIFVFIWVSMGSLIQQVISGDSMMAL